MTLASDANGNTAPTDTPGFPFGPYLQSLPWHPFTGQNTVSEGAIATSNSYYDESIALFAANDTATNNVF